VGAYLRVGDKIDMIDGHHIVTTADFVRCVVVCCSVLQCVAVCCSALQSIAVCCSDEIEEMHDIIFLQLLILSGAFPKKKNLQID